MQTREQFGRRSAGGHAIPEGAPDWVVRSILESRAAMARGEYRPAVVKPNTFGPMVRAVSGPHPRLEERSQPAARSQKKKWAPTAGDLRGLAESRANDEAAEIAQQQNFLNTILS